MITRAATLMSVAELWDRMVFTDSKEKDASADRATKVVWLAAGVVGTAAFFGSFGFLAMPFIGGWSWLAAGAAFVGSQYASQIMLDLPEYWSKASGYVWLLWTLSQGKNVKEALGVSRWCWDREVMAVKS